MTGSSNPPQGGRPIQPQGGRGGLSRRQEALLKSYEYLGVTIDPSTDGEVQFSMFDYLEDIISGLPGDLVDNRTYVTPAAGHLSTVDEDKPIMPEGKVVATRSMW